MQKKIGEFMKKKEKPPAELTAEKAAAEAKIAELETLQKELIEKRDNTVGLIGAPALRAALPSCSAPRSAPRPRPRPPNRALPMRTNCQNRAPTEGAGLALRGAGRSRPRCVHTIELNLEAARALPRPPAPRNLHTHDHHPHTTIPATLPSYTPSHPHTLSGRP